MFISVGKYGVGQSMESFVWFLSREGVSDARSCLAQPVVLRCDWCGWSWVVSWLAECCKFSVELCRIVVQIARDVCPERVVLVEAQMYFYVCKLSVWSC